MKKILLLAFSAILLLACLSLPAFAAGQGTMTVSSATGCPGDSVSLSIAITENPGTSSFQVRVGFDSSVLQLTGVDKTTALGSTAPSPLNNPCSMNWADTGSVANTYTGTIATLTFRILDGATPGSTNVSVSFVSSYDLNLQRNTFNSPSATVTVTCPGHVPGTWSVLEPAGCVTPGKEKANCTLCGSEMQRDITPVGHSFGDWQTVTPAGCTALGKEERECTRCHTKEDRDVNPLGHAFSSPVVTKPATCKEAGVETGTCTRCNEKSEQAIPVLAHNYGAWEKDKDPTCTETGTQKRVCRACDHKLTRKVAATGHDFEEPKLVKQASLYEEGLMEGKCKKCKETTQQTIPCSALHADSGVAINATSGIFTEGAEMNVTLAQEGSDLYDLILSALAETGSEFYGFSLDFHHNGVAVVPGGVFSVVIPAPDFANPAIYAISAGGEASILEYSVKEDGSIVAEADSAVVIAVLNTDSAPLETLNPDSSDETVNTDVSVPDDVEQPSVSTKVDSAANENSSGSVVGIVLIAVFVLAGLWVSYWYFFVKR